MAKTSYSENRMIWLWSNFKKECGESKIWI